MVRRPVPNVSVASDPSEINIAQADVFVQWQRSPGAYGGPLSRGLVCQMRNKDL